MADENSPPVTTTPVLPIKDKESSMLLISLIILGGFFAFVGVAMFHAFPIDNKDTLMNASGALISLVTGVGGFWLGSSVGSSRKNDLISK